MRTLPPLMLAGLALVLVAGCAEDGSTPLYSTPQAAPDPAAPTEDATADPGAGEPDADATPDVGPLVDPGPPFCDGPTQQLYDPVAGADLGTLPDDWYAHEDPTSPTGLRLAFDGTTLPWLATLEPSIHSAWADLHGLDGWGVAAPVFFRFDGPLAAAEEIPSGESASVTASTLQLLDLGGPEPVRIPFEAQVVEDESGTTLLLWPMVPLRPATAHAALVTTGLTDAGGDCLAPSAAMRDLLTGALEPERLAPRYAALLAATALAPEDLSAATVFTTQVTTDLSEAVAADIRTREYHWTGDPSCSPSGVMIRCERTFESHDYRTDGVLLDADPHAPWEIIVSTWLPAEGEGPWPTIVMGHGINSSRDHAGSVASALGDLGFAVIAADAMVHGDHPTAAGIESEYYGVITFLGIDVDGLLISSQDLRDNFRQTNFDRLQLVELAAQHPDVDADGSPDLDVSRLGYVGISLGGIMGSQMLALEPRFQIAALITPGARLTSMFTHAVNLGILLDVLEDLAGSTGAMWRAIAAVQAGADAGDAVSFAPHVLRDRLVAGDAPHVLVTMALGDEIVPNITTRALARALDVPVLAPVLQPVGLVPTETVAPVVQNLNEGGTTAAMFQFDRVSSGGSMVPAAHDNLPHSVESRHQLRHFFSTWLAGGPPEILDPYVALDTPPLP